MDIFPCRVCGLDQGEDHWNPGPSYAICDCCQTEFGLEDVDLEQVRKVRMDWLTKGAKWSHRKSKPDDWHSIEALSKQLKNIPYEWW